MNEFEETIKFSGFEDQIWVLRQVIALGNVYINDLPVDLSDVNQIEDKIQIDYFCPAH